jgi:anti-anti-sigma factor
MSYQPEEFDIAVEQRDGVVVVRPKGDLDIATTPLLDEILADLAKQGASAVLDLAEVDFLDSSGLQTILKAHAVSERDGLGLTMLPGPPAVMRVFELSGTTASLPFDRRSGGHG